MGCFTAVVRHIERTVEYWSPRIEEAFQTAQAPTVLARMGLSAPAQGEAEWREWTVVNLDAAQCRALALQARQEATWEEIKAAALTVGGVFVSAVLYPLMVILAGAVFVAGMFLTVITADYLEVAANVLVAVVGFVVGEISSITITVHVGLRLLNMAPRLWTKELSPAIIRAQNHARHLRVGAVLLEARAASLEAIERLSLSAEEIEHLRSTAMGQDFFSSEALVDLLTDGSEGDEGDGMDIQNLETAEA